MGEMARETPGYDDINHSSTRREAVERFMWDLCGVKLVWSPQPGKPTFWWPGSQRPVSTASTALSGPRVISVRASRMIPNITLAITSLECDEKFSMQSLQRNHSSSQLSGCRGELIELGLAFL